MELQGQSVSYDPVVPQQTKVEPQPEPKGRQSLNYGSEPLDLDWLYSPGAMKMNHVRQFVNLQAEENDKFAAQVIMNDEFYPIKEGMRKPTIDEYSVASDQQRTEMRRGFLRKQLEAIDQVDKMTSSLKASFWDNGMKVIAREGVREFNDVLRKAGSVMFKDDDLLPDSGATDRVARGGLIPGNLKELVKTTSIVEGTSGTSKLHGYKSGYDVTLGFGAYDPPGFDSKKTSITDLTIQQIFDLQGKILGHPKNTLDSTAVGKWQMTRTNIKDLMDRGQVDIQPTDKFTPEVQDKLFMASMEKRGLSNFLAGNITKDKFMAELRAEWQGLHKINNKELSGILDSLTKEA